MFFLCIPVFLPAGGEVVSGGGDVRPLKGADEGAAAERRTREI